MAVLKTNNANGITTGFSASGGTLTAAATAGGGNAFDRFNLPGDVGTGNDAVITVTPTLPTLPAGNKWYHITSAGTAQGPLLYWTFPASETVFTFDFYLRLVTMQSSASVDIFRTFSDAIYGSASLAISFNINASRTFYLRNGKTGEAANGSNSSGAMALNTNYYVQCLVDYGALNATVNVYPAGSGTILTGGTASITLPTSNQIQSLRWGNNQNTLPSALDYYITNIRTGDNLFNARPDLVNTGPVISQSLGARRTYQTSTVVLMPWSATDADNIASLVGTWFQLPAGVSAPTVTDSVALTGIGTTTASRTEQFTPVSPGTYIRQITATDSAGSPQASTATYTIEVYPAANLDTTIRAGTVNKGSFTVVGGPANDAAGALTALSDSNAATALDSIVAPTNMTGFCQLGPLGPNGIVLFVSANVLGGGTLTRTWRVYKEDHTTQIYTTIESGITGVTTDVPLVLDNNALLAVPLSTPTDVGRAALWVDWSDTVV